MAQGFKNTRKGISARFTAEEASLLQKLFSDVADTLEPEVSDETDPLASLIGISENSAVPTDPAVARILPVASDDPEVADEYRRFTELSLRQQKIGYLQMAALDVEAQDVVLDAEHARGWAAALNDVRLTLATRLDITSDADASATATKTDWRKVDTVEDYMALVYNFVSWLLDTLMEAMLDTLEP
ncbi:DUF2017 domain-containing protein [uncultured Rothia sp.]|uniref:DUF2017 domain-containing protein n=1 Tax=uncultured Rothia sp. TaxID=316088 RepID=UPI003217356B